ncbi:unnamed protein product [Musa hybrid cultivar]
MDQTSMTLLQGLMISCLDGKLSTALLHIDDDSNNGLHRLMDPLTRGDFPSSMRTIVKNRLPDGVHKEPVGDVESIIRFHWDQLLHHSLPFRRRKTKLPCRSNRYFWLQIFPQ